MSETTKATAFEISPRELKTRLDSEQPTTLVDVRSPEEYHDWHIRGSVNLPLDSIEQGTDVDAPRHTPVVTICLHGPRAVKARDLLAERGFSVRVLAGGMVGWNRVFDVARLTAAGAEIRQMRRVGKGCLSYVLASGGEAIVIDPTIDIEAYVEEATKMDARIVAVLDTHAHADHVSGGRRLAQVTGAKYLAPEEVGTPPADGVVRDGDKIPLGGTALRAMATPGHTPSSVTYLLDDVAFTGDTLFVESVGRPDLGQDSEPNAKTLWSTLHDRLLSLPPTTRALPGHYGDAVELVRGEPVQATIGALRRDLPALKMSRPDFVEWIARNALPKPENFLAIKRHNRAESDASLDDLRELEAGPNRCAVA